MELSVPFIARGEPGEVHVRYAENGNPARWGYDVLGLEGDVSRAADFPVFEANVSYTREGYAAIFGWVQIVRYWADSNTLTSALVDVAPQLRGFGVPFMSYGVKPICFDAPLDTPEGLRRWEALSFLTQTPDGLITRHVEPIVGLSWGYLMESDVPTLVPPTSTDAAEWQFAKAELERACPTWTFGAHLLTQTVS
jgi:hypothetical protein